MKRTTVLAGIALVAFGALAVAAPAAAQQPIKVGVIYGLGGAAELLGIRPSTLNTRIKKLGLK